MIVIRNLSDTHQVSDTEIRIMVRQRIDALGGDAFDTTELGYFLVVEVADTLGALSAQMGFPILCNRWTGICFGQPGFTPSFEFVEEFETAFDLVTLRDQHSAHVRVRRDDSL